MATQQDEVTSKRDLPDLGDDLDEETNIIDGEEASAGALGEVLRSAVASSSPSTPKSETPPPNVEPQATVAVSATNFPDDSGQPRSIRSVVAAAVASVSASGSAAPVSVSHASSGSGSGSGSASAASVSAPKATAITAGIVASTSPALTQTANSAQTHASPLVTAIRVAVVFTTNLEVRVLALGANETPPPGAAVAILVPQSDTDGAAIAKLLGVTRS